MLDRENDDRDINLDMNKLSREWEKNEFLYL